MSCQHKLREKKNTTYHKNGLIYSLNKMRTDLIRKRIKDHIEKTLRPKNLLSKEKLNSLRILWSLNIEIMFIILYSAYFNSLKG